MNPLLKWALELKWAHDKHCMLTWSVMVALWPILSSWWDKKSNVFSRDRTFSQSCAFTMSGTEIKDKPQKTRKTNKRSAQKLLPFLTPKKGPRTLPVEPDRSWLYELPTPNELKQRRRRWRRERIVWFLWLKLGFYIQKQQVKMWASCLNWKELFRRLLSPLWKVCRDKKKRRTLRRGGIHSFIQFLNQEDNLMSGWFSSLNIWLATLFWAAIMLLMM